MKDLCDMMEGMSSSTTKAKVGEAEIFGNSQLYTLTNNFCLNKYQYIKFFFEKYTNIIQYNLGIKFVFVRCRFKF